MWIALGFVVTVLIVAAWIVVQVARSSLRVALHVAIALAVWLAVSALVAYSGAIAFDDGPPKLLVLPLLFIAAAVLWLRSDAGRAALAQTPPRVVVALQAFRAPVELVLWGLYFTGKLPERLTFEGHNLDVLVGLSAIPIAYLAGKKLTLAWHVAGLLLLTNIVTMAIRAQPAIIPTVPYVWLPAFLVPVALLGHLVGLGVLRSARSNQSRAGALSTPT